MSDSWASIQQNITEVKYNIHAVGASDDHLKIRLVERRVPQQKEFSLDDLWRVSRFLSDPVHQP